MSGTWDIGGSYTCTHTTGFYTTGNILVLYTLYLLYRYYCILYYTTGKLEGLKWNNEIFSFSGTGKNSINATPAITQT